MVIPWSVFWERNYFVEGSAVLRTVLTNNYVRGALSGLGIVNVCFGLAELAAALTSRKGGLPSFDTGSAAQSGPLASAD